MASPARIYLDNAATSSPKPPAVLDAMIRYATDLGGSPGRGAYRESREAGRLLSLARQRINRLIHGRSPDHDVFTLNCSDALNTAIKGAVGLGPAHVITTELDHNSILRPLNKLAADGLITQTRLRCDPVTGAIDPGELRRAIRPDTRLIAALHASNVTGAVLDVASIGAIARERGVLFLLDAAQSLGHLPVDVQAMHVDLLAAPGHKGLLGPLGTGFLYINPDIEKQITTLREGGTGSLSEQDTQPLFMPDRFEPGSHNTPGILGLSEGVQHILDSGIESMRSHELQLMRTFLDALGQADAPGLQLYGSRDPRQRVGVFSFRLDGFADPQDLSARLEQHYGILTRSGLHCAPGAHRSIETHALGGTTRLSFGPFLTVDNVRFAANALAEIARKHAAAGV